MPLRLPHNSSMKDTSPPTAKAHGENIDLQQTKRMSLSGSMDSVTTQNGIWLWTSGMLRTRSVDTSFLTAISQMCTAAAYSQHETEPPNTDITMLKMQP